MTTAFTGGGALAQQLAASLTPAMAELVGLVGSDCTIYRAVPTKHADNSTVLNMTAIATDQRLALSKITAARAQKVWGVERNVTGEVIAPGAVDLEERDAIKVTAGPYTGEQFLVDQLIKQPEAGVMFGGLAPYKGALP